ncbi:MAG: hypothetical protein QOG04_2393 [Actinomycetota bacterium]|jgi:hypothetical protein|nr:hypothetical protein [Actinomycetota bacterium]
MAIKGKRKTKGRSTAARKRPASAPRPASHTSHGVRWYKTMGGQLTIIIGVLALIGFGMWRFSATRADNKDRDALQDELAVYTGEVEGYINAIQEPVREMLGAPFNTANPETIAALEASTKAWIKTLEENGALIQALEPPQELTSANVVIQQAILLYGSTAKTYALVPGMDDEKQQQDLLTRAAEFREQAGRVLGGAIGLLDQARTEAGMRPSGIDQPSQMAPILPTPEPAPSESPSDSGNGKKKSDG